MRTKLSETQSRRSFILLLGEIFIALSGVGSATAHAENYPNTKGKPSFEDTVEYLAIHKDDTLSAPLNSPRYPYHPDLNRWYVEEPESFKRGWDEILNGIGTKGSPTRRLAIAYWFSYFRHSMEKTKASILNMMRTAEEKEIPIYIHLDGTEYWRGTGLWNWWNPDVDEKNDPGARYDPNNINNVERYGWDKNTAVKIAWRDWGSQHRAEYRNGMAVPAPNLASPAFRKKNAEALGEILPIIVQWYNALPSDKKYLLAGVVLGAELSVEMNAVYFRDPPESGSNYDGNDFADAALREGWDEKTYLAKDKVNGLNLASGGKTVRLGYAAAQTLGLQTKGVITGNTIDLVLNNYIEFLIKESLKSGISPKKLITHAYPPPRPGTWYKSFNHMEASISKVDGVVPGWTTPIMDYEKGIDLNKLKGRPWAAIETHFWAILNIPKETRVEYIYKILPGRLNGMYSHGNCRHVNIKDWEFPLKQNEGFRNAIRMTLSK